MAETIPFWLHLLGAAIWIGSQFYVFLVQMPALRAIDDVAVRHRALGIITRRFNIMGWAALMLLVLTGIGNVFERDDELAIGVFDFGWRYAWILIAKLALVSLTTVLTFWHTYVIGPRQMALMVAARSDQTVMQQYRGLRAQSIVLSTINLLAGIAILFMAALLRQAEFSIQAV